MTFEEGPDLTTYHHHLLDWLEDSISFIPSFLDDPYSIPESIAGSEWWTQEQDQANLLQMPPSTTPIAVPSTTTTSSSPQSLPQPEFSKKRKLPTSPTTPNKVAAHGNRRRTGPDASDERNGKFEEEGEIPQKPGNGRKGQGKGNGGNSGNGNKEVRWAEHLLNPCATAIEVANLSRVQHLLCVLHELASPSGDANHRLAAYGLRTLTRHLSSTRIAAAVNVPARGGGPADDSPCFVSTEPKLFRSALIKFHDVSPWFALPNSLANASILQALTLDSNQRLRPLHVVDIGVSHGVQWPTLLEALTRRPGGPPALVRLTVAGAAAPPGPFSAAPPGYDFSSHLLRYAKSIDLNLRIERADSLAPRSLSLTGGEILVVCAQFRVGHGGLDARTALLQSVRELNPDLMVLSEVDGGRAGEGDGSFPAEFGRRAELLWRFLDSTSAAFKGRDCAERRVVEGEAARVLEGRAPEEGKERWREMMVGLGFRDEVFGEEAVEAGRALLRKYDGNWEMRAAEAAVGLWWKGQPVSFCSLWKPHTGSQ
ncbi:protein NODULATION SIGNALING PATHWAY 1-like [Phoenix dactylifera]|uniref:Protein NODULATION SIGNALING PATHWAY 1-like n=1 Tax=Phoenix dactylifera TaxID=42345 RepID=A0A8B7CE52_PHODC|nr:protein NODULATION SIGNALING PATHWAY 1-like [Phoenix dactylifera]